MSIDHRAAAVSDKIRPGQAFGALPIPTGWKP
jgi:hypothetical protein